MIRSRTGAKGLAFALEIEPDLERFVSADVGKLRQILINLLGNAVKFTTEGGVVLRACTKGKGDSLWLEVEVEDSGAGIPQDRIQAIFDPFVQVGTASNGPKGTGLGLAISHSFIELMGGEMSAESRLGKGSVFRFKLPVVVAKAEMVVTPKTQSPIVLGLAEGQPVWRILVVEDDTENRRLLTTPLLQAGFQVREAEHGEAALAQYEAWHPHLIWMDMQMPVMDGYEATRRIRARPGGEKVKILAITASAFREQLEKIIAAGCDEVLHKPYQIHELFDAMANHLGVRYRYEEAAQEPGDKQAEVNSDALAALPDELLETLRRTALFLDNKAFSASLEQVRDHNPALADGLADLEQAFRFDLIQSLIENAMSKAS
jgi:CheY-like chemotaxis protein